MSSNNTAKSNKNAPTKVQNVPALAALALQCQRHKKLTSQIQPLLPEDMAPWCTLGNIHNQCLTMVVASSSWASRLRFISPQLIKAVTEKLGITISRIDIKIDTQLFSFNKKEKTNTPLLISNKNAQMFNEAAQGCPNEDLKALFLKLAKQGDKQGK